MSLDSCFPRHVPVKHQGYDIMLWIMAWLYGYLSPEVNQLSRADRMLPVLMVYDFSEEEAN